MLRSALAVLLAHAIASEFAVADVVAIYPLSGSSTLVLSRESTSTTDSYVLSLEEASGAARTFWRQELPARTSPWKGITFAAVNDDILSVRLWANEDELSLVEGSYTGGGARLFTAFVPEFLAMLRQNALSLRIPGPSTFEVVGTDAVLHRLQFGSDGSAWLNGRRIEEPVPLYTPRARPSGVGGEPLLERVRATRASVSAPDSSAAVAASPFHGIGTASAAPGLVVRPWLRYVYIGGVCAFALLALLLLKASRRGGSNRNDITANSNGKTPPSTPSEH